MVEGDDIITTIQNWQRVICHAHAQQLKAMAALLELRWRDGPQADGLQGNGQGAQDYVPDEIALALTISRLAASHRLDLAYDLTTRLPATLAALDAGELDLSRVQAISDATSPLTTQHTTAVESRVLDRATQQNAPQLRRALNAPCSRWTRMVLRPGIGSAGRTGACSSPPTRTVCPG